MTDPATIAAIADLADELAPVSEAMIEAGSRAETELLVEIAPDGKRRLRMVGESQRFGVIWRAMLAAKLGGIA